ncbi:MAG TPA: 50S ribosomal protein L14 [Candidatus Paceibacterota bacterium]|uniref:Large ribosomal subunit protein uL14 n=1 Tax=uncultured Parcubacteria bacterium Rifle_16ft_4_minimus_7278 TaxID=1665143 RepID=A0A0H4T9Y5_9BACT|nr:50S ribosomal protein L14 [uncultured Parcubacteria bacterium Rifle_16ft_4_minimus_7278]HXK34920.1 50S ribosomal protein L14 [Candidatus Paceibacterota bacterium]
MVQDGTIVKITDNTGGRIGKIFKVLGGAKRRYALLGDLVILSVKVAEPRKPVKKHDVVTGVIVRQVKPYRRADGSYISFDDNAVVIVDKAKLEPVGGRIFGPIPRELGEKGFQKIISLAPEVL